MNDSAFDLSTAYTKHLGAQAKATPAATAERLACPYCSTSIFETSVFETSIFDQEDHLWRHVSTEHPDSLQRDGFERGNALFRQRLREAALHKAQSLAEPDQTKAHLAPSLCPEAAATTSTPDLNRLSLDAKKPPARTGEPAPAHRLPRKRAASDIHPPDSPNRCPNLQDAASRRSRMGGGMEPRVASDLDQSADSPLASLRPRKQLYDPGHLTGTPARSRTPKTHRLPNLSASRLSSSSPASVSTQTSNRSPWVQDPTPDARYPGLVLQPDSRPISQEQLAAEVKSIYAGLTMVETKCIHVDKAQASAVQDPNQNPRLQADHWQALIALHRTLLHEHHDFFLASQHPSASPALRRLAAKYSMPARMWKHGIHSFLELLRHRLPESLDYMLSFIYLAYQMMALLYETVPAFEDTWIECLGDLGRYRMAIEDEDLRDRETWAGVARFWYSKAADKSPAVGRLYHHLAILARPNALQQLYFYCRSLTCVQPFMSARESILTLFEPILGRAQASYSHSLPVDTNFIRAHGLLFEKGPLDVFDKTIPSFLSQIDPSIERLGSNWKEQGAYIAIANIAGLFDYGNEDSFLRRAFNSQLRQAITEEQIRRQNIMTDDPDATFTPLLLPTGQLASPDMKLDDLASLETFSRASQLAFSTLTIILRRSGDKNVLSHLHIILAFLNQAATLPYDTSFLFDCIPYEHLAHFLNTLTGAEQKRLDARFENDNFFDEVQEDSRPLPEDYLMRGQLWAHACYPDGWFDGVLDEEGRSLELASTVKSRIDRVLWLGIRLASFGRGLTYNRERQEWSTSCPTLKSDDAMDHDFIPPASPTSSDDSPDKKVLGPRSTTTSSRTASKIFIAQVTIMVCDASLLLRSLPTFTELIRDGKWPVVIPSSAISHLSFLMAMGSPAAKSALDTIDRAISNNHPGRGNIRILTATGKDISDPEVFRDFVRWSHLTAGAGNNRPNTTNSNLGSHVPAPESTNSTSQEENDNSDKEGGDIAITITRQQSDLSQYEQQQQNQSPTATDPGREAKRAVLVTESRRLRLRAARRGVAAVAGEIVRKVINGGAGQEGVGLRCEPWGY